MEILKQLADLFLQAIPSIIIIAMFYVLLNYTFFQPILRVMAERAARTEGARKAAEAGQAAAREKVQAYEEALRKARGAVYAEQDVARRVILDERADKVRNARTRATEFVSAEKETIAKEMSAARTQLEETAPDLAAEMVRTLMWTQPDGGQKPASGSR
jgi:F-type H+-transporting ATPase subunit b